MDFGISRWLVERSTPLLWVSGVAGAGKTAAVETALARAGATPVVVLRLSAAHQDDCLAELYATVRGQIPSRPVTKKQLLSLATEAKVLFIDALDIIQQDGGEEAGTVTDSRFRQLLISAGAAELPGAAILVTSRLAPPRYLPLGALTMVSLQEGSDAGPAVPPQFSASVGVRLRTKALATAA